MPHFIIVLMLYINLSNLSWIIKCLFLRNMEPLRSFDTLDRFSASFTEETTFVSSFFGFSTHYAPFEKVSVLKERICLHKEQILSF